MAKRGKSKKRSKEAAASRDAAAPERMPRKEYEKELRKLQVELCHLQEWVKAKGLRAIVVFEGRDTAGKGGTIKALTERVSPRVFRVIALPAPSDREKSQMFIQRYFERFPAAGEIVIFDRSWYNRAGVEHVMGFCTEQQHAVFLREAPEFEGLLVRDGIRLFKFYLEIGREMQLVRFHERRHDPLKQWKISDIDLAAMARFDDYSAAKEEMFRFTHTATAPWTVILANDQRRARLEAIRCVLCAIDFEGKDAATIGKPDANIVGAGPEFFATR